MKRTFCIVLLFAAVGCSHKDNDQPSGNNHEPVAEKLPADNTGKNERDQDNAKPTPFDQSESEGDRAISQQIRQEVVKGDALSISGKNVKIITVDGVVTLRGPVESEREKADILALAKHVSGVKRIDNQLEVAAK